MTQPVTVLLRAIWENPSWRVNLLTTFEHWVRDGASRKDVKERVKLMIEMELAKKTAAQMSIVNLDQVNWDQLVEFLCTCFYRKQLRSPLPDVPSNDLWLRLIDGQKWGALSLHPQQDNAIQETVPVPLYPLEQKLLTHGGIRMIYRYEPDLKLLLQRGHIFNEPVDLVPGDLGQCHSNVARIWNEQRKIHAIVTGYALSEDSLWRQHSWLLRETASIEQHHLVETTIKRIKYFGVILTEVEAESFFIKNK